MAAAAHAGWALVWRRGRSRIEEGRTADLSFSLAGTPQKALREGGARPSRGRLGHLRWSSRLNAWTVRCAPMTNARTARESPHEKFRSRLGATSHRAHRLA